MRLFTNISYFLLFVYSIFLFNYTFTDVNTGDSASNKENIPPANKDDEMYDFDKSSFKYDDEYSTDDSYKYSSEEDISFNSDNITIDSSDDKHPMNHGVIDDSDDG